MLSWFSTPKKPGSDRFVVLVTAAYALLAILLLPTFQYHLQNDSFAYLSLAARHAGNPYWGPLLPRLIALGTAFGLEPLLAIRLPNILGSIGLLILAGSCRTVLPLSTPVRNTALTTLAVFLLCKTLDIATPDILLTFLLALGIFFVVRTGAKDAILAGLSGGLAYLTKSVGLPFFVLFAFAVFVLRAIEEPKRRGHALKLFALSTGSCVFMAAPWIATVSLRHGGFTIGESAHVIHATMNPLQDREIPMNVRGLLTPPTEDALSIWDDPTALEYHEWSPFSSVGNAVMQMKIIVINASRMVDVVFREFWLAWAFIGAAVVYAFGARREELRSWSRVTATVWGMLAFFYLPIVTDDRYVWIGIVLVIGSGALMLDRLMKQERLTTLQTSLALAVFALAFTAYPAWRTLNAIDDGRAVAQSARAAASVLNLRGVRTASDNWKVGLAFSYFADTRYFGRPKHLSNGVELGRELQGSGIDVYIATSTPPEIPGYREIRTQGGGIRIFRSTSAR